MKIVIFGMDNSGKSTLAQNLEDFLLKNKRTVIVEHSPGVVSKEDMINFMRENKNVDFHIFDRYPFIEEMVYGPLFRNNSKFSWEQIFLIKDIDLFVFCNPGLFNTINWGEREQFPGVKENCLYFIQAYEKIALILKNKGYKIKEYNYNCDLPEDLLNEYL